VNDEPPITRVDAELVTPGPADRLAHLGLHRGLIIRRSLLIGAMRGFFPLPVVDEQIANRLLGGLYGRLARGRQVDLPAASAAALYPNGGIVANLTIASAAVLIASFAGRKFLALLAAGRGADEMAATFYRATLFDHYCATLHVGGPITLAEAGRLREAIETEIKEMSLGPGLVAFREGGKVLGRNMLEAPRWLSQRIAALAERFIRTGGNPDVVDAVVEPAQGGDEPWLERAARSVEEALGRAGSEHLDKMIAGFEGRLRAEQERSGTD
jgi:hypothetical protein